MSKDIIKKPATGVSKWLAKETLGNFIYDQIGVLWRSAIMTAFVAAALRLFSGIPLDVWLIIALFGIALLVFVLDRLARRRGWLAPQTDETQSAQLDTDTAPLEIAVPTKSINVHAECETKIARLLESENLHALRATAHEDALKAHKEEYAMAIKVANYQAPELGKFVEVVRVCTHDPKLDDPMPTIKWAILLKNRSVFRISLNGDVGSLFFEGHKLTEHKDLLENKVMGLWPDRDGSIVFEQRLSTPEVNLLKSLPNGKFEFDKVMLHVKDSDAEDAQSHRVVIFSRFRATLGRCSDEKSQAIEEAAAQLDSLRAELNQTRLKLDRESIAERKALIASWRSLVEKATREYWDSGERGFLFPRILESQEGYMTLSPHLPSETKHALSNARHADDSDVSSLVEMLADDIAQIERDWQV